jgi:hypothetical protein
VTAQAVFLHRGKEAGRSVYAVAIKERHGRSIQLGSDFSVFFRERRASQEAESGPGVQLDEGYQS